METIRRASGIRSEEAFDRFEDELEREIVRPPHGEVGIAAVDEGSLEAIHRIPAYQQLARNYIAMEHLNVPIPSYWAKKWYKAHQIIFGDDEARYALGFPDEFINPEKTLDLIKLLFSDPEAPDYKRLSRILSGPLQTNRWERKKVVAAVLAIRSMRHHHSFDDLPRFHEYGATANLIGKALANNSFTRTEIVDSDDNYDPDKSRLFDVMTHMAPHGEVIGVDERPLHADSIEEVELLKGFTLDPSQFDRDKKGANSGFEDMFDTLAISTHPHVSMIEGNILRLTEQANDYLLSHKANVGLFSHSLVQNAGHYSEVLETVFPFIDGNGTLLVHDYVSIDPNNTQQLIFEDNWYYEPWKCRTLGLDMNNLAAGFYPIFEWEDGRLDRGRIVRPLDD